MAGGTEVGSAGWSRLSRALVLALAVVAAAPGCAKRAPDGTRLPKAAKPAKPAQPPKDKYSKYSTQEIFDLAQKRLAHKSYYKARELFQKVLGRQDTTPDLIALVHLGLADAYFFDGGLINLAEALSRYTNFLTFYPNHARADYAQYQLGLCYLRQAASPDRDQSQARKALAELDKVAATYPNSEYVAAAQKEAAKARELLAEHDFRIGNFYFRQKAYTGAVQRLREVLDGYPGYSRKDKLYLILGQSLIGLKKDDEGRLYLEKLVAEYPASRYADEAREFLKRPVRTANGGS